MTMTTEQIRDYVLTYLQTTGCQILDQSPYHVTTKLSPEADKELTGRPFYWGFIERTQTEPETMSFLFVFDPEQYDAAELLKSENAEQERRSKLHAQLNQPVRSSGAVSGPQSESSGPPSGWVQPASAPQAEDSILGRYFGVVRPLPNVGPGRIQREHLHFGSPRLNSIFSAAKRGGSCVYLFEDPGQRQRVTLFPAAYEPWLGVCFKAEFACDMKREELHFIGVSLSSGRVDIHFRERLEGRELTPRLPENIHIEPTSLSLDQGREALEQALMSRLDAVDSSWAIEAHNRLQEELELIDAYYKDLLLEEDPEKKLSAQEQYGARRQEIRWQYEPRILVSAINCGIFHLRPDPLRQIDRYR
ncbi:YqhG family protein [Paenibacillus tuaregi]|uniref:YqhG family protein n=1 Tax=Paenibacillus tuaregi TaxID=1816681 RepID=UPI0008392486|nr:YqhG family protein [Paenibacillus tuaregi]